MTAPVRDVEIVLGKWLAALSFFALLWLPTLLVLWLLTLQPFMGVELAFGPVLSGYLGLFLLGALFLAAGCFTSSLTDNLLLAALAALLFNYTLLAWPSLAGSMIPESAKETPWVQVIYQHVNVFDHLSNWFARGLVDTSQVVFYLGGSMFFLFLTVKSMESRRWR